MKNSHINLTETVLTWKDRLKKAGKTQDQAAAESGISTGQISQYLSGKNSPNITKFEQFENYLRGLGV